MRLVLLALAIFSVDVPVAAKEAGPVDSIQTN